LLLNPTPAPAPHKRIGLITRDAPLESILRAVLTEWGYLLLETVTADTPLLVQEGCLPPAGHADVLWLTSSHYDGGNRLSLPVALEALWFRLESRYHKPQRNHIRLTLELPATVVAHGEDTPARVYNLSDLGARFEFPREMVSGENLSLAAVLGGERLTLHGRVIYVVPRGDLEGTGRSEIGMIFNDTAPDVRMRVREYILWHYLSTIRCKMDETLFAEGLGFLDIPESVRQRLGCG